MPLNSTGLLYYDKYGFAVSHIPKCACSTFCNMYLYSTCGLDKKYHKNGPWGFQEITRNLSWKDVQEIPPDVDLYYIIRNPYSRVFSSYIHREYCSKNNFLSPEERLLKFLVDNLDNGDIHHLSQLEFIKSFKILSRGTQKRIKVVHFEELDFFMDFIRDYYGYPKYFHANKSPSVKNYKEAYSFEAREIFKSYRKEELRCLGYSFDSYEVRSTLRDILDLMMV